MFLLALTKYKNISTYIDAIRNVTHYLLAHCFSRKIISPDDFVPKFRLLYPYRPTCVADVVTS